MQLTIGHSLKWRYCSLVWSISLLKKKKTVLTFDPLERDQSFLGREQRETITKCCSFLCARKPALYMYTPITLKEQCHEIFKRTVS